MNYKKKMRKARKRIKREKKKAKSQLGSIEFDVDLVFFVKVIPNIYKNLIKPAKIKDDSVSNLIDRMEHDYQKVILATVLMTAKKFGLMNDSDMLFLAGFIREKKTSPKDITKSGAGIIDEMINLFQLDGEGYDEESLKELNELLNTSANGIMD